MADYVVEPIGPTRPQRSLSDIISDAVDAGLSDAEIKSAVAKRKSLTTASKPAGHGRGDELFQPDPSPSGVVTVGRRLPKTEVTDTGDVDLGKLGMGPAAAGAGMVAGTSYPGAPPANEGSEARGFMRFAAGGLAGMAGAGAAGALGAGPAGQAIAGGAAAGAAPTAMEGAPATDIVRDAGIGAAAPTVGAVLTGAGKAVLASKGAKARQLIEGYGGKVGLGDSGSGLPEFAGRGKVSDYDIGEAARESGQKLLAENDRRLDTNGKQPYQSEVDSIKSSGMGRNLADASPVRTKMEELAADKRLQPDVRERLRRDMMTFDKEHGGKRWVMSEADMNDYRRMYFDRARFDSRSGAPGAPEWAAVGGEFKSLVDKGPFEPANAKYAKAIGEHGDFREAFGMAREPSPNEQIDERRIANALARRGQTTTTAGVQQGDKRMDALLGSDPALQRVAAAPELLRAKADLQPGIPEHGGLIHRVAPAGLVAHNLSPLTGRALYNPARAAVPTGQALTGAAALASQFSALQAALAQKKQRDAMVIDTIFGKSKPDDQQDQRP